MRRRRKVRFKSCQKLGEAIGVHGDTVEGWERGEHLPNADMWPLLMNTINLDLAVVDRLMADAGIQRLNAALPTEQSWAGRWTSAAVQPWLIALASVGERALYIYGARRSGKTFLVDNLCAQWSGRDSSRVLRLNIRVILDACRMTASAQCVHEAILSTLNRQIGASSWRQSQPVFDFSSELHEILAKVSEKQILLVVEEADAAIRTTEAGIRTYAVDATSALYDTLKSVMDSAQPSLRRVQGIFTGSRPVGELEKAYERSPFNGAHTFVVKRFSEGECTALCRLAGLVSALDADRVYHETGGHRSLVWALLSEVSLSAKPEEELKGDLLEPVMIQNVLLMLQSDLNARPFLAKAFQEVLAGRSVDGERATLLKDAMLAIAVDNKLSCQCPLLEEYTRRNTAASGASK